MAHLRRSVLAALAVALCAAPVAAADGSHGHGKRAAVVPVHKVAGVPAGEHIGAGFAADFEESESAPSPPTEPCALVGEGSKQALFLGPNNETVTCTVDRRTQLIVFGLGASCSDVEEDPFFGADEAAQRACAIAFDMEFVDALRVSVDGGTPVDIRTPRFEVISPQMTAEVPADSPAGLPEGTATLVAHAWMAEVRKLRPGRHLIEAQAVSSDFDITSRLIVNIRRNGHG